MNFKSVPGGKYLFALGAWMPFFTQVPGSEVISQRTKAGERFPVRTVRAGGVSFLASPPMTEVVQCYISPTRFFYFFVILFF